MVKYACFLVSVLFANVASAQITYRELLAFLCDGIDDRNEMISEVANLWDRPTFDGAWMTFAAHEQSLPGYQVRQEYKDNLTELQRSFSQLRSDFTDFVMTPKPQHPNECYIDDSGVLHRRHLDSAPDVSLYTATLEYFNDAVDYAAKCLDDDENLNVAMMHLIRSVANVIGILLYCDYVNEIQDDMQQAYLSIVALELIDFMGLDNGNPGDVFVPGGSGSGGVLPVFSLP